MILTGTEIRNSLLRNEIEITPFVAAQVGTNSYDIKLGPAISWHKHDQLDSAVEPILQHATIPETGFEVLPNRVYLAESIESIRSIRYAVLLKGRSSNARQGLFININADLIHCEISRRCPLQIYAASKIRIYSGMRIGQLVFCSNTNLT